MSLARMLAEAMESEQRGPPYISKVGQVARLAEEAVFYGRVRPFKLGDLVTPRVGTAMKGAGTPHRIVDVRMPRQYDFSGDPSSNAYGVAPDIRVVHMVGDSVTAHWCESWQFEPYVEDGSKENDAH